MESEMKNALKVYNHEFENFEQLKKLCPFLVLESMDHKRARAQLFLECKNHLLNIHGILTRRKP
jgi:hypothetical protein